jgi:hypothetical protein
MNTYTYIAQGHERASYRLRRDGLKCYNTLIEITQLRKNVKKNPPVKELDCR